MAIHQGFISDITELPSNIQNLGSIGGTIEGNSGNNGYSSEISGIISLVVEYMILPGLIQMNLQLSARSRN